MQIVSSQIRRVAEMFLFAAGLNKDKVNDILEGLEDLLGDKSLFETVAGDPLVFNKKGIQKLQGMGGGNLRGPSFAKVVKQLDGAIKLSVRTGDKELISLNNYLEETLRQRPGTWTATQFQNLDFDEAKDRALTKVIKPVSIAMTALISPRSPIEFPKSV